MTWATIAASGEGRFGLFATVEGVPLVMADSHDWTPSGTWYSNGGWTSVKPWLVRDESIASINEEIRHTEGSLEVSGITLTLLDPGGQLTALFKAREELDTTWICSSVAAADMSLGVLDSGVFAANDYIWFGHECCRVSSVAAGSIALATSPSGSGRSFFGTTAAAYTIGNDLANMLTVCDGIHSLVGRAVKVYAYEIRDGVKSTTGTCIYRGHVAPDVEVGAGRWRIPVNHCSSKFDDMVGTNLPSAPLRPGYYYQGTDEEGSLSSTEIADLGTSTYRATVDAGWYNSPAALGEEWNAKVLALGLSRELIITNLPDYDNICMCCESHASADIVVVVKEGSPLWALGFNAGYYILAHDNEIIQEAENQPRLFVADFKGSDARCELTVEDATVFTVGQFVAIPEHHRMEVQAASGTTVTLSRNAIATEAGQWSPFWSVTDKAGNLVLQHVVAFSASLSWMIRQALGHSGSIPREWRVDGLYSDDVNMNEFESSWETLYPVLGHFSGEVRQPTSLRELIAPRLGLLGIAPRLTSEGRIGWTRLETPTPARASTIACDDSIWASISAATVKARVGGESLVNMVRVEHSHNPATDEWSTPLCIKWFDGFHALGEHRTATYSCRGLQTSAAGSAIIYPVEQLARDINTLTTAIHFGIFGRESATVELPCTWRAKQFSCGDIVQLTHETIPDRTAGTIGTTSKLAIVVGRIQVVTDESEDALLLRIPPTPATGAIAPAALGTSWNVGTLTLTFGSTTVYAQTGDSDLDGFAAGDEVTLYARDSTTSTVYTGTIDSMTASTVTFDADPWSGASPGTATIMTLCSWDSATAAQQLWAYIADDATATLGINAEPPMEWSI